MWRALAIDEQSYGKNHPSVAVRLNNLALLLQDTNRLAEAEPLMWRALAIDEQSYGKDHPHVANCLNNLAGLLHRTNRLAEAEPLMRRMVEIILRFTRETGDPHPRLKGAINNYASLLQAMGRDAEEIRETLMKLGRRFAVDLSGMASRFVSQSPKLRAVIDQLMRDPSKTAGIAAKLKREDPKLLMELRHWINSQNS
jgi:tetratricopeptide (TPR) repeat protein